ncbi:MAG: cyclic nucleotide-binding domain-containing protein [Anaerolineae bacterium]|nr:cyclic nucleotide-binding domain-containing protein [Anaerolineae bacterium]
MLSWKLHVEKLPLENPLSTALRIYLKRLFSLLLFAFMLVTCLGIVYIGTQYFALAQTLSLFLLQSTLCAVAGFGIAGWFKFSFPESPLAFINLTKSTTPKVISDSSLEMLTRMATQQTFNPGQIILRQGNIGDKLYVIQSGKIIIYTTDESGKEILKLNTLGAGDFFGELALLDNKPRSANVRAMEATTVLILDQATFLQTIGQDPMLALDILRTMSLRMRQNINYALELTNRLTDSQRAIWKIIELGLQKGKFEGKEIHIEIDLVQDALANLSQLDEEAINWAITYLSDKEYIDIVTQEMIVRDYTLLFPLLREAPSMFSAQNISSSVGEKAQKIARILIPPSPDRVGN